MQPYSSQPYRARPPLGRQPNASPANLGSEYSIAYPDPVCAICSSRMANLKLADPETLTWKARCHICLSPIDWQVILQAENTLWDSPSC